MPAVFDENKFTESGYDAINEFIGTLVEFEDDVDGNYGPQIYLEWGDVEITDCDDENLVLDDNHFHRYHKQSNHKNGLWARIIAAWKSFHESKNLDGDFARFEAFKGKRIKYQKERVSFGEGMSPGVFFKPVEVVDAGASTDVEEIEPSDELVENITAAVGDGATKAQIDQALKKKAANRKALKEAGGLDKVLDYLVTNEVLTEEDGVYASG